MSKIILSFFLLLLFTVLLIAQKKGNGDLLKNRLPILISYRDSKPPDSIREFVETYLRIQKKEITTSKDLVARMKEKLMTNLMEAVNAENGKIKDPTDEPLANVLGISIFNQGGDSINYVIDSIRWFVGKTPAKDTSFPKRVFRPHSNDNCFIVLKNFIDTVLVSGLLK